MDPVNGNPMQETYDAMNNNHTASNFSNSNAYGTAQATASSNNTSANANDIPKDEVGWYFVEQYYTTLSRSPEKLFLFYNKRSQFVSGTEEDKVPVCIGQKSINDRIKELDYHDCKVRVTNVDSQGSDANIVIQVIGEISNKGQPHKRFVQTFVLAEQTNGYFVLNDIFRYLAEEPEEEEEEVQQETAVTASGIEEKRASVAEPETEPVQESSENATSEEGLKKVDEQLESAKDESAEPAAAPAA
ncbi:NTF2-like protein, partial [Delitschia confertaspora ATCC 74209]